MADTLPDWMGGAFSGPRMKPYLEASGGDAARACRLYWWNIEVSAALYGPLHCLEVTLRNALHGVLVERYGRADWWEDAPLNANGHRLVTAARAKCERHGKGRRAVTADGVVAELSFGFWASLVSKGSRYDRDFWVPAVHKAFPHYSGRRDELYAALWSLVLLRNRIMHHEPVHGSPLAVQHAKIYRVLGYLDPDLVTEIRAMDRFPAVLRHRGETCDGTRLPRF
ncbi:Abi-like protein [Streptomyces sp. LaPpAH-199]|uniref:hypothetical protein n=1 Tax=Streptomyces TaxID=1883 RepID=UPI000883FF49|nr:hypothetical protein [Streptomyces sp. LaPpAH-199]MYW82710.1 hypothetical protein [Streptomyces sp. SID8369]SDD93893.1 Abi-like protein [Streptomyces sp. LaPpAH-199]